MCSDLEWKIIYVGSASSESHDQTLDSVLVGPIPAGLHKFVFQADAPTFDKIPPEDAVGVTVVLLTCSFKGAEFVRVGFYVNNEYLDPELAEQPPLKPQFDKVRVQSLGFMLIFQLYEQYEHTGLRLRGGGGARKKMSALKRLECGLTCLHCKNMFS